jgi:hypothetical protein
MIRTAHGARNPRHFRMVAALYQTIKPMTARQLPGTNQKQANHAQSTTRAEHRNP